MLDLPALDDDDGLPVVSMENKNLPVFARFPFDVTVSFCCRTRTVSFASSFCALTNKRASVKQLKILFSFSFFSYSSTQIQVKDHILMVTAHSSDRL